MATQNYSCSQSALYQVSTNVLQSMSSHLTEFGMFKVKYTSAFINDVQAAIVQAENLPDFQARQAQSEVEYINLCSTLAECTTFWQTLKRYIISAYPGADQKPRLEQAGANYYEKAIAKNWDAARALVLAAQNFLVDQNGALSAQQNMPATFPAAFAVAKTTFTDLLTTYQQSEETLKINTANKINSNNALYATILEICLDGQQIFKSNQPLKDQFVFSTVLGIVSGNGTTGFKGYIVNATTGENIANVNLDTVPPTKTIKSDADGFYEFRQIPAGTYTIHANLPGFQPQLIANYLVDTGIMHNLQINLDPNPILIP